MNRTPRLFKAPLPDELVLEFFRPLGLTTLADTVWIQKSIFTPHLMQQLEELLPLIEPYYQGYQKHYITRTLTPTRYIQILRHICKSRGMKLNSKEMGRKKEMAYQLQSGESPSFSLTSEDWL